MFACCLVTAVSNTMIIESIQYIDTMEMRQWRVNNKTNTNVNQSKVEKRMSKKCIILPKGISRQIVSIFPVAKNNESKSGVDHHHNVVNTKKK